MSLVVTTVRDTERERERKKDRKKHPHIEGADKAQLCPRLKTWTPMWKDFFTIFLNLIFEIISF